MKKSINCRLLTENYRQKTADCRFSAAHVEGSIKFHTLVWLINDNNLFTLY